MQTERCDLKCMIEYGLRYRQSSIRLMCSSVPAMTNLERREKEKELERTKEDMKKEKEELREIHQELQQIREEMDMKEQDYFLLQERFHENIHQRAFHRLWPHARSSSLL